MPESTDRSPAPPSSGAGNAPKRGPNIDRFLAVLIREKGSDLHLAVGEPPRLRVDGQIKEIEYQPLTRKQVEALLYEIMTKDVRETFEGQWDVDFAYASEELGRFRVNAFHQINGMSAVFRVIPTRIPTPKEINMPLALRRMAARHQGLVLITGPTGSGKSTTLAALVNLINLNRAAHIVTIEDPIEFVHESKKSLISQREVGQHARSFNSALRAALREDPDVILVGELRDIDTMALAITAAETGHLVLGTLHTMSAAKTIDRLVDSFPGGQQAQVRTQLSEALAAVVAQQLLPRRDGNGRIAAFEVMLNNRAVANHIRESKTQQIPSTMQTSRAEGMQLMDHALLDLVEKTLVTPQEALGRAIERKFMVKELKKRGYQVS